MKYLVQRAQQKNNAAFVELIEQNKQGMYKVAKSYLHNDEDVADAIQETVLTCYEKLHTLRQPEYFKTWLIRILINQCKNMLRKNRELGLTGELPEESRSDTVQADLEFTELLQSLDEKYRTILVLYYVEGFHTREIAELLELNEHTVKTRLARARKQFARLWEASECSEGGRSLRQCENQIQ